MALRLPHRDDRKGRPYIPNNFVVYSGHKPDTGVHIFTDFIITLIFLNIVLWPSPF